MNDNWQEGDYSVDQLLKTRHLKFNYSLTYAAKILKKISFDVEVTADRHAKFQFDPPTTFRAKNRNSQNSHLGLLFKMN